MSIINLTPDSFLESSRVQDAGTAVRRVREMLASGATIMDFGAVSTRPGADPVPLETEWERLEPVLSAVAQCWPGQRPFRISVDTTRAEIVRRAFDLVGPLIVNDISAGEDDPSMLLTAGALGLGYVAMHKKGDPHTMDALCEYPHGVVEELLDYFQEFSEAAAEAGVVDWILDPGLGFAKTPAQCWEILERLGEFKVFGRPVLVGAADKRFTAEPTRRITLRYGLPEGDRHLGTALAHSIALGNGADILRVHRI